VILIIVDVQVGLDDPRYGQRNNARCEERITTLLGASRKVGHPVLYTQHLSQRPGSPLAEGDPRSQIKSIIGPTEPDRVYTKTTNSAFKSAEFRLALERPGTRELVFVGMATDACITATAREAKDLGYEVTVVADACATFPRQGPDGDWYAADVVHHVSLAALAASGIEVCTCDQLLGRLSQMVSLSPGSLPA